MRIHILIVFIRFNNQIKSKSKNPVSLKRLAGFLVERGGFEPPKSLTTDLQSAPFGHSGISPYGAGDWT